MALLISCDWGTSSLRLRLCDSETQSALSAIHTAEGIASVWKSWQQQPTGDRLHFYSAILQKYIDGWKKEYGDAIRTAPILISGMASSSIGMVETPYASFPFRADGSDLPVQIFHADNFSQPIYIISGAGTEQEVMRGEETLLAGCDTTEDGLYIFPGTHSKHITVTNGIATGLLTYMTGEFFELLSKQSVLAGSVEQNNNIDEGHFFEKGVRRAAATNLLNSAFSVRVSHLFKRASAAENYHYLSGLLIGSELKEINEKHSAITLVADGDLMIKYAIAIKLLWPSSKTNRMPADAAMVKAHCKISNRLHYE